ncbi:MAG: diguanylate cyclase, partial [Campylobacteraceae bacterium]|nr:diguanylate cyclase [Campylobacteraceae bacterium]
LPFDNSIFKDVQLTSSKIFDSEKNLLGSVCTLHDITEFQLLRKSLQHWKERYELALGGANDGLWDWDIKSDKIFFSRRWKEIMGYHPHEKTDNLNHWLNLVHSSSMAKVNETLCAHLNGNSTNLLIEHSLKTKNTWVRVQGKAIFDKDNKPTRLVGYVSDITEERHFENEIRLFAQIFENTSEGILVTDPEANIITVNSAFCYLSGYSKREAIGKNPAFRKSNRHDKKFYERMWSALLDTGSWRGEIYNRHKNGTVSPESMSISTIKDEAENIMYFVGIFSNISKQKEQEEKLHRLAHYDTLTKLPNRYLFLDRLNQCISQHKRSSSSFSLLFIDLDNFKPINDLYGHEAGDLVLKTVALRLGSIIRQSDTVARLAGDEFVVILSNVETIDTTTSISQKILTQLNTPLLYKEVELQVSASIGICIYPEHGKDTQTLLHNADTAMYRAKHRGKNGVYIYGM